MIVITDHTNLGVLSNALVEIGSEVCSNDIHVKNACNQLQASALALSAVFDSFKQVQLV